MKQSLFVSKFLELDVKKLPAATSKSSSFSASDSACEVVAVGPVADTQSKGAEKKKHASVALHKDVKALAPVAAKLAATGELSAKAGASCLIRFFSETSHLLLIGSGRDGHGVNALGAAERVRRLGAQVYLRLKSERVKSATVHLESFLAPGSGIALDAATLAYAFAEGAGLAAYEFKKYQKSDSSPSEKLKLTLGTTNAAKVAAFEKGAAQASATVAGAVACRDFGNEPSNELFPIEYAKRAQALAKENGLKFHLLDEKDLQKEKMGLLLGVGQGSVKPPCLFVMEYAPKKATKKTKTIAFVGKGITFDSGGISIKPSTRMEDMKHDMCGSAAVIGATIAAAKLGLPVRILCVVAAAENMPSGAAIQPGNILKARNGKTVEVTNTDAEGRLVLADALDYVQDQKPDYIIDLATLTGAVTITLGKVCAGMMSNDRGFAAKIEQAAKVSGERVWELPLFDEYFDDLKSDYADMRNSGDSPSHGTAKGAMFLQQFIREGVKWAHMDIAAVAYAAGHLPYCPKKSSSGYGVRLLVELAKTI